MNNRLLAFFALVALVLAFLFGFVLFWNSPEMQAARAASLQVKTESDVQTQLARLHIESAQAALALTTEAQAQPAAVFGRQIAYIGFGVSLAILTLGLAAGLVSWSGKKAATIYPGPSGQLPLIRVSGFGFSGFVDPNRGTGLTLFRTPTWFDVLSDIVNRVRGKGASLPAPEVQMPLALSEPGTLLLTSQASTVAVAAAATRFPESAASRTLVKNAAAQLFIPPAQFAMPLPPVEEVDPSHVDRLLALTGDVDFSE